MRTAAKARDCFGACRYSNSTAAPRGSALAGRATDGVQCATAWLSELAQSGLDVVPDHRRSRTAAGGYVRCARIRAAARPDCDLALGELILQGHCVAVGADAQHVDYVIVQRARALTH